MDFTPFRKSGDLRPIVFVPLALHGDGVDAMWQELSAVRRDGEGVIWTLEDELEGLDLSQAVLVDLRNETLSRVLAQVAYRVQSDVVAMIHGGVIEAGLRAAWMARAHLNAWDGTL